jgi:LemA protein
MSGLVRIKHNVSKAWSNIDVLLKQRHDEIPKLVETCKQYMKFEQEDLVARKKLKAYTTVAAGLLIFSTLVVMFSIRTPLPV